MWRVLKPKYLSACVPWAIIGFFVMPGVVFGQVNTEKLRSWESPGFGGAVDGSLELKRGNTELLQLAGGLRLQYALLTRHAVTSSVTNSILESEGVAVATATTSNDRLRDLIYLVATTGFGRNADATFLSQGFMHLRWTRMWQPQLGTELFAQLQFDEFTRLKARVLSGAGLRWAVIERQAIRTYVGTAAMIEHEELNALDESAEDNAALIGRLSSYLSMSLAWEGVEAVTTLYVQPRIDRFRDYRILSESEAQLDVVGALKLAVNVGLRYDRDPPAGVQRLDVSIQNKLRVVF